MTLFKKFKHLFDPIDLTKGSITKDLILFLIPTVLSLIFQQIYSLTDAIIAGQYLSETEIAGLNDAVPLVNMALNFTWGCTSGFSVIVSNKIGAKNPDDARKSFWLQAWLSLVVTVILTISIICCINPLLKFIGVVPSTEGSEMNNVYIAAATYVFVISLGIIAQVSYNWIISTLRALGDSFTPFLFLIFSTLINIGLDFAFIVGCHLGVAGAALATILSELLAAIGSCIYTFLRYKSLRYRKGDFKVSWNFVKQHLRLGLPLGFQYAILQIGIIIMQAAIVKYDYVDSTGADFVLNTPAQLGYSVANKLDGLLMSPLSALGTSMLSYIGQNYGAHDEDRIKKGYRDSLIIGLCAWIFVMTVGLLMTINGAYQYVFLADDKVTATTLRYGNAYLYIACPCLGILMVLFVTRNTLQGLNKPLFPFLAGIGELFARSLICLYAPALINGGAIDSTASIESFYFVCAADPLAWLVASCILLIPMVSLLVKSHKKNKQLISLSNNEKK